MDSTYTSMNPVSDKLQDTDTFVEACENLLELMLKKAGVGKYEGQTIRNRPPRLLLDLGCGCGDSSIYLSRPIPDCKNHDHSACQIVDKYVGLTLDMKQHKLAKRRLESARLNTNPKLQRHLFCADAARPSEWSSALKGQLRGVVTPTAAPQVPTEGRPRGRVFINDPRRNNGGRVVTPRGRSDGVDEVCPDPRPVEKWILALDCLYHFAPSRQAIFQYGNRELGASIMAFDLILAPDISMFDWYRLWLLTLFISAPISNFVTAEQYKEQLIEAGYSDVNISIEDITPDCFAPLVRFLGERDKDLQRIGVYSFGKFRMAKRMFSWFAKGNVVRACVIVAKL